MRSFCSPSDRSWRALPAAGYRTGDRPLPPLTETQPGLCSHAAPALVMVGKWALAFQITPKSAPPFTALILDQANG